MRPEERDAGLLWDMRELGREAMAAVEGLDFATFLANRTVRLAVERLLQNFGEAARRVSPAFQSAHVEVPWRDIVGQRNVLAHDYGVIDPTELWETLTESLLALMPKLDALIPPCNGGC